MSKTLPGQAHNQRRNFFLSSSWALGLASIPRLTLVRGTAPLAYLDGSTLSKQVMSAGSVKTTPRLVEARVGRPSNPTPVLQARPAPPSEGKWLLYDLPGWIHDDNVRACLSCNTKFTLWNRRVRLRTLPLARSVLRHPSPPNSLFLTILHCITCLLPISTIVVLVAVRRIR